MTKIELEGGFYYLLGGCRYIRQRLRAAEREGYYARDTEKMIAREIYKAKEMVR